MLVCLMLFEVGIALTVMGNDPQTADCLQGALNYLGFGVIIQGGVLAVFEYIVACQVYLEARGYKQSSKGLLAIISLLIFCSALVGASLALEIRLPWEFYPIGAFALAALPLRLLPNRYTRWQENGNRFP